MSLLPQAGNAGAHAIESFDMRLALAEERSGQRGIMYAKLVRLTYGELRFSPLLGGGGANGKAGTAGGTHRHADQVLTRERSHPNG
jgi:hypothetical protein